ncbi:class A sortase [Macrococcus carouselicus]|uniref:Class A sortase n=1 Tax=Macrococcus carouselicus TaxID=69969 RepID=A0A9Q8FNK8_9STAP|nr:class A sortase [Macrococcus carouselicus]TDM03995.1 class A sortase [Macrococcus carouselicus]
MRIILRLLGVLLILAAAVLFFWQDIRAYMTDQVNAKVIQAYEKKEETPTVNELEKWITKTEPDKLQLKDDMLGYLKIPAADINEPLLNGPATQANLKNGVSLVEAGEELTEQNIAIAGHRVEGAGIRFNYLDRAKKGDIVTLVTRSGAQDYKIYDIFTVNPSQVDVLREQQGKPQELTLITCESYNPETLLFEERMIVKARILKAG